MTLGVLALQGAFKSHIDAFARCGVTANEVRTAPQLEDCTALVVPGGESSTMANLFKTFELIDPLRAKLAIDMPVMGTCAGMILMANSISDGQPNQLCFDAIDIAVRRNGYGRQIDSFETDLAVAAIGDPPIRAVFIRAPVVEKIGPDVEVLAELDDVPVLCRQGNIVVSSFHPELTDDDRIHQLFLDTI